MGRSMRTFVETLLYGGPRPDPPPTPPPHDCDREGCYEITRARAVGPELSTAGTANRIAQAFHEAYEDLAPRLGYRTREDSAVVWEDVPERDRVLMVATVLRLLDRGVIREGDDGPR